MEYCVCVCGKSLGSYPTLCNPVDCSPPGSSVLWILQARTLEWIVISSSRGSSRPRDHTHVSCSSCTAGKIPLGLSHLGSPVEYCVVTKRNGALPYAPTRLSSENAMPIIKGHILRSPTHAELCGEAHRDSMQTGDCADLGGQEVMTAFVRW